MLRKKFEQKGKGHVPVPAPEVKTQIDLKPAAKQSTHAVDDVKKLEAKTSSAPKVAAKVNFQCLQMHVMLDIGTTANFHHRTKRP